jgi:predicted outer membrane repeat protein
MRRATFVLLACLSTGPVAEAAVFTVGADGACTHANLLSAISAASANGPGLDEIRIATNQTYTSIIAPIASHSVHVRGGFATCAASTPSGLTRIVGASAGSGGTFTTSGSAAEYRLELENLELRDTLGTIGRRGGALRIEGNFTAVLDNTIISGNRAGRGGGVYVDGSAGASLSIGQDSVIANNTALIGGGGIYCQGDALIFLTAGLIAANVAEDGGVDAGESGNGGGVALFSGCSMLQRGVAGIRGVRANTAARHGGGYFVRNEAGLSVTGTTEAPAVVADNLAGDTGGGLAVLDDFAPAPRRSYVQISDSWIESNLATSGGGIGLVIGGEVIMRRLLDTGECHGTTRCSSLSDNDSVEGACLGGAAFLGSHSMLSLQNTLVRGNCAAEGGWAIDQRFDSQLRVDSSVVAHNRGVPFRLRNEAFTGLLEIAWSTVYGNFQAATSGGFIGVPNHPSSTGTLRIFGSILGEPFQQMTSVTGGGSTPPMTFEYDCLVLDSGYSAFVPSAMRTIKLASPYGMTAPDSGNYRPASGSSPIVDGCDASTAPRANGDFDRVDAVHDAVRPNQYGIRDLGAHEFVPVLADAVFADGFE